MPPARQATRSYPDIQTFLTEYESTLSKGVLLLPAEQAGGELAPEIKLELLLPLVGRTGPVLAQVVARLPDGGVALRLPEIPPSVDAAFKRVFDIIEEVRVHLLKTGAPGAAGASGPAQPGPARQEPPPEAPVEDEELVEDEEDPSGDDEIIDDALSRDEPPAPAGRRVRGVRWSDTSRLPVAMEGTLQDGSLRRALISLALGREQGLLMLETEDGRLRQGYWAGGGPVAWRSEPVQEDELLGNLLVRSGLATAAQLEAARQEMERTDRRQGEILVSLGAFQKAQLPMVLTRQAEFVLMRVLQEKAGSWSFYRLDRLPEDFLAQPVAVAAVLLRAFVNQARRLTPPQLRGALKRVQDQTLTLPPEVQLALRDLRYSKEEALVLDALRLGTGPVTELVERGPAPFEVAAPLVWALSELGLAAVVKKGGREERLARASAALAAKQKQVAQAGPFEVLELSWICLPQEIERSRDRLRRELSPDVLGELTPELESSARGILDVVENAAAQLLDPTRRRQLRRQLISPEDLERSAALLREAAEQARASGDGPGAALAEAKAAEILAS